MVVVFFGKALLIQYHIPNKYKILKGAKRILFVIFSFFLFFFVFFFLICSSIRKDLFSPSNIRVSFNIYCLKELQKLPCTRIPTIRARNKRKENKKANFSTLFLTHQQQNGLPGKIDVFISYFSWIHSFHLS